MRSSSFDESLPETSTVTLNHHDHDVSDVTTPSDDDSDDELRRRRPHASGTSSNAGRSASIPATLPSSTTRTVEDQLPPAVYAVPSKPPRAPVVARDATVERRQPRTVPQQQPPKPARARRPGDNNGVKIRQPRGASAAGGSRPRIPPEYLTGQTAQTSTKRGTDGGSQTDGFDASESSGRGDAARTNGYAAADDGYRDHNGGDEPAASGTDPRRHVETILPPPEVFSDTDVPPTKTTTSNRSYSSRGNGGDGGGGGGVEAVYSEVVDVLRPTIRAAHDDDDDDDRKLKPGIEPGQRQVGAADELHANGEHAEITTTTENGLESTAEQHLVIRINKTKPILGIAIEGGANTKVPLPRIAKVQTNGSASESGLRVGHTVIQVDGRSLAGLSHIDCARAIAQAFRNRTKSYMDLVVIGSNDHDGFDV